jgi:thioredoxin-like negative regulator of GroEL
MYPRYVGQFGIRGAPTLIVFKDGQEVDRLIGSQRKSTYQDHFDAILSAARA